ncbi:cysteine protease ATG4A-like isoform X2 [Xenia sp. Carnegie-2017]|uniref:cysteine protease ATG4A-like isoform X2 n=1 Tax=Xenia sp. Carnegie-2017 TaxID=2897299 RepID=UPI001F049B88|nr:cysteine protease ATG4A-like isoform X2 [Xenia sp. Carnegie-2017]
MDSACFTYEGVPILFNQTPCDYKPPVWILGKYYDGKYEEIEKVVKSCLWFTYRKGFTPIGGTGPTSDAGWGCMLRCGQMILAEALVRRHLGKGWVWNKKVKDVKYMMILNSFLDKKDSFYSIHQIAQMGVSEGKNVGSWFGPNTIAQVLRKLVQFDEWSKISVHVAMDNTVVINDITQDSISTCKETKSLHNRHFKSSISSTSGDFAWKPLVLFIPLRLGLSTMNLVYENALKKCFTLAQSLGCIGGRPNHASYFIGYNGNKLLYLDPHVTQTSVVSEDLNNIADETFHCCVSPPWSMSISDMDPSVALGFYCETENEFNELCFSLREINKSSPRPLFEVINDRPPHWPPYYPPTLPSSEDAPLDFETVQSDIDEEYEII